MSNHIELIGEGLRVRVLSEPGWVQLNGVPYDVKLTPGEAISLAYRLLEQAEDAEMKQDNKENN